MRMESKRKRVILPGKAEALIHLPIDCVPSRSYTPRWGHSRGSHELLQARFRDELLRYVDVVSDLVTLRDQFSRIPLEFEPNNLGAAGWANGSISPLDAACLYYFLKRNQSSRYVEIGSGVSTTFAYRSKIDNHLPTMITAIDPQPRVRIGELCEQVWRQPLEDLDLSLFEQLWTGDIVLLDGSHRSFMNSDVTVFFLDVLPRLKPGVLIGVHNVHLPDDYPPETANSYWSEQYLLAAFLLGAGDGVKIELPAWIVRSEPALFTVLETELKGILPAHQSWIHGTTFWFSLTRPLMKGVRSLAGVGPRLA